MVSLGFLHVTNATYMMTTSTQADAGEKSILVRMCHSQSIVATSREAPSDDLLAIDLFLCIDPIEHTGPLSIRAGRILLEGRRVAGAGDLGDDRCDAFLQPALLPDCQLCTVAIQASDYQHARCGRLRRCIWREEVVDRNDAALAFDGVLVRDLDFDDWVLHKTIRASLIVRLFSFVSSYPVPL
jgi:hypothetical protein